MDFSSFTYFSNMLCAVKFRVLGYAGIQALPFTKYPNHIFKAKLSKPLSKKASQFALYAIISPLGHKRVQLCMGLSGNYHCVITPDK